MAVDAFYKTSEDLVTRLLEGCLLQSAQLSATSVALPALGTGYGRLPLAVFGRALRRAWDGPGARPPAVSVVVATESQLRELRQGFGG